MRIRNLTIIARRMLFASLFLLLLGGAYLSGYGSGSRQSAAERIDASTANTIFKNYYQSASPVNGIIKGFTIDMAQFSAMTQMKSENPGVAAFTVYFGQDNRGVALGLVVGIDGEGNEMNNTIASTLAGSLSSCPIACDAASAITKD